MPSVWSSGTTSTLTIDIELPSRDLLVQHVLSSLKNYWPKNSDKLLLLPIQNNQVNLKIALPLQLTEITMPTWATDLGVKGQLLVPKESLISTSNQNNWENVDWWLAIFLLLEGWHERLWEKTKGVIHSYSFRLKGWDSRAWEYAWVNRIGLFLREWIEFKFQMPASSLLGDKPKPKIHFSFDVDAVYKTTPIRLKQSCFQFINAARHAVKFKLTSSINKFYQGLKFLINSENWDNFEYITKELEERKITATFNFYGGKCESLKSWLMDPGYVIESPKIKNLIHFLIQKGHTIGLHLSYDSFLDFQKILTEKKALENASGLRVHSSRQHWLRFKWASTLQFLEEAQIFEDSTIMFNDRPGFRTSTCIEWNPWNPSTKCTFKTKEKPTILMDSHLFDYNYSGIDFKKILSSTIEECKKVGGECYVLWHPHTLSSNYGWNNSKEFTKTLDETIIFK